MPRRIRAGLFSALVFSLLAGCAINPVTGQRELVLMSPEREAQLGRQAASQVAEEMGLVESPALTAYVDELGQRLARHSPRRDVVYRFAVVDMEEPNAFALPGGYIYVSRGLLAIADSEAELANVIGHEIGHVAARHSAQRETRALGVGVLAAIGTIAAGAVGGEGAAQGASQIAQVAGAGLIASYGRDQERQADEVGQELAAQAGWDPAAMASFLRTLGRDAELRSGEPRRPSFLDSHPMTDERVQNTAVRADSLRVAPAAPISGTRSGFYARLENLLIGPNPAEGLFREERFLHPDMDFALDFPRGWETQNGRTAVAAQSPRGDAALVLQTQGENGDPGEAAETFARENELELWGGERDRIGGFSSYRALEEVRTQQGTAVMELTWIAHPRAMFRLLGLYPSDRVSEYARDLREAAQSFRRLTDSERDGITELRLRVATALAGESLASLSRRTKNAWSLEETAVANDLSLEERLREGEPVKIVVEVPYRR
jgi:predicted Zn-dependent protease